MRGLKMRLILHFNPRSRVGNDSCFINITSIYGYFNPRSRVGNDEKINNISVIKCYFNPRSRVGNDEYMEFSISLISPISIHVPAWGTTHVPSIPRQVSVISIHVPAWGTTNRASNGLLLCKFQSTFPRGERQCHLPESFGIVVQFQSTFPRGERL